MNDQIIHINNKAKYIVDMDGEISESQHKALTALIKFIQSFDDRYIQVTCIFEPIMGGMRISTLSLGKITIYGSTGNSEEILIIAVAQLVAETYNTKCFHDHASHLKNLLTTAG